MQRRQLLSLAFLCALLAAAGTFPGHASPPPAAGTDFQVNVVTEGNQAYPAAAQDAAGGSVVAWLDQGALPLTVKARRFDAAGTPLTPEIVVGESDIDAGPRVAMTPLGDFAVTWQSHQQGFLRRYDRLARPVGAPLTVSQPADLFLLSPPDLKLDAAGNAFVAWAAERIGGDVILLQRFDAANQVFGPLETVNQYGLGTRSAPRVALNAAGSLLVSWDDQRASLGDVWVRRFDGPTGTWGLEARVGTRANGVSSGGTPLLYPEGDGAVVFLDQAYTVVLARLIDAHGVPISQEIGLAPQNDVSPISPPSAALSPDGTAFVAWTGSDSLLRGAFFDRAWSPLGRTFALSSVLTDVEFQPAVAASPTGGLLVTWTSGGSHVLFPGFPPDLRPGRDGSSYGVYAQRFQAPACAAGSASLCLGGGLGDAQRFSVQVSWKNPYTGETGTGKSAPLNRDTGAFWFFDPANLELMIKVLDGRAVNGNFWVFYGSLSNVEYTVTVTDTTTGAAKTYHNAPFQLASQADVDAFPGGTGAVAPRTARVPVPAPPAPASFATAATAAAAGCTPTPATLCSQNRFQVAVSFVDPRTGATGSGQAVTLSDDTGIFWFFDPANLELMVKVLDGTAVNGRFWVFYGGLSDVDYTLTVTDTATGAQRTYHNPQHHLASAADLDAF